MIGVAFGLTGTLVEDRGLERAVFGDFAGKTEIANAGETAVAAAYEHFRESRASGLATERALANALPGLPQEPAGLARAFALAQRSAAAQYIVPFTDVRIVLQTLSQAELPCVIFSCGVYAVEAMKASLIDFTGPVVVPQRNSGNSPTPYRLAAEALHLPVERVWFVSALHKELDAARLARMNTVEVNRAVAPLSSIFEVLSPEYARAALVLRHMLRSVYE